MNALISCAHCDNFITTTLCPVSISSMSSSSSALPGSTDRLWLCSMRESWALAAAAINDVMPGNCSVGMYKALSISST